MAIKVMLVAPPLVTTQFVGALAQALVKVSDDGAGALAVIVTEDVVPVSIDVAAS